MEDEDEFRDADDGVDTSPPPSPSPASTPSKSKPAAAGGGFGRRLLASIGLPTSFSAAIGRSAAPSHPKPPAPQPPVGPNLGLGLLLHQGPNPFAEGSLVPDASVRGLHLPPTADLQKQHQEVRGEQGAADNGQDQVIGHDAGVEEELAVLVPEEEVQEKEDVADGCSGSRYGYSAQDLDKEGEQYKCDELEPAMEDQEVMEQEGATKYYNAVENQSNNDTEQCSGDAPTEIKDDKAVEEKEEAMEQGCAVGILGVAEDGVAGGLQEEDGLVEGQCKDAISVQDQHKVEQCWNDELGVSMGDSWVHDIKEVVVGKEGVTEHFDAAVDDQSNNAALEQRPSDELGAMKDGNVVEDEEKVLVEQKGSLCILGAADDGIAVGLRKEDIVVEDQGEDVISVHDQDKVVDQCMSDELGVPMGYSVVHDPEEVVVVVVEQGVTEPFDAAVDDQNSKAALEQRPSDELGVVEDGNVVEYKKVSEQKGSICILGAAEDGIAIGLQKEDVVVEDQGEKDISVHDQDKVVQQCMSDELGLHMGDSAVHDPEVVVVEPEGVSDHFDAAVEDQINNAALEQHTSDDLRVIKDGTVVEYEENSVEQESTIDILGAAEEGLATIDISAKDQDNMVEQGMRDELGVAIGDQEVVVMVEKDVVVEYFDAVMEDQCNNAAMEQCASDELREVKSSNVMEGKVKRVEQEGSIGLMDAAGDGDCVGEEDVVVEGQGGDGISIQDKHKDQCTSDELEVAMGGSIIQDHDLVANLEDVNVTEYFAAMVEDQSNNAAVEQCTHDKSKALRGGNFVEVKEEAVDMFCAAKDLVAVQSQEKKGMVVEDQCEDGISIHYQYKVLEQCTNDKLEVAMGDSTAQDQDMVVEQGGITEYFYAALENQSNNASVMPCTSGELSEVKDDNIVETKDKSLEQDCEFGIPGAAENSVAVDLQGEGNMVVEGQGDDDIFIQDERQVVEQCISDDLGVSIGDSLVHDQEEAVLDQEGVTGCFNAAVEDNSNNFAVVQCTSELEATKDDNFKEKKEKAVVEGAIDIVASAKDDHTLGLHEEEVVAEQGEDVISSQDQYKAVVEQEGAICVSVATVDDVAIDAQEKAVEQSTGDESSATKGTEEEVVDQVLIQKQDAIKGGSALGAQEGENVAFTVKEEGEDGISVQDQDKVVEQGTSDQWRTTVDDNAAEDQEVRREKIRLSVIYPQRPGRSNCRAYMSTGSCPYGLSCYLNHPQLKTHREVPNFPSEQGNREVAQILELNRVGLPIRENAKNCMYYMRNGTCGYGKRCCYNHPEHVLDVQVYKPTGWDDTNFPSSPHSNKSSSPHSKKSSEHANLDDTSSSSEILPPNILRMLLPPQTVPPGSEAKEMKVKKDPNWSSASDHSDGCCSADSSGGPLCKQEHHADYPERPGRQECPFLLKYGNCKFVSACNYHHPNDKYARSYRWKDPSLSEKLMVYPDKPGEPECPFYMKTGTCKFGAQCKFHHPKDLPPSMRLTIPKRPINDKEFHPETKTTLQDHMDQQQNYPERPGQPECRYYLQFGTCKFLSACIFHHPKDRVPAMPECPFYMKTGSCQFGSACEFYHPRHRSSNKGGENDDGTEYGYGYPQRPGGHECFHYMKHGYCKFQMNCKYHHPTDRLLRK